MTAKEFKKFIELKAQIAEMEEQVKKLMPDALEYFAENHKQGETFIAGKYKIGYCEGAVVTTIDKATVEAFYLTHYPVLPKVESMRKPTFKTYKNK